MQLLNAYDVQKVRSGRVQYGEVVRWTLSRVATCRSCGARMPKGTPAIGFTADFKGSGSWTGVRCYMHADACEPATPDVGCVGI